MTNAIDRLRELAGPSMAITNRAQEVAANATKTLELYYKSLLPTYTKKALDMGLPKKWVADYLRDLYEEVVEDISDDEDQQKINFLKKDLKDAFSDKEMMTDAYEDDEAMKNRKSSPPPSAPKDSPKTRSNTPKELEYGVYLATGKVSVLDEDDYADMEDSQNPKLGVPKFMLRAYNVNGPARYVVFEKAPQKLLRANGPMVFFANINKVAKYLVNATYNRKWSDGETTHIWNLPGGKTIVFCTDND